MSAGDNGEYRRPSYDRQIMVVEKGVRVNAELQSVSCLSFSWNSLHQRSLQGESDNHIGLTPVRYRR